MKYTPSFSQELMNLKDYMILQKEHHLQMERKRHFRKLIAMNLKDPSKRAMYESEFRETAKRMLILETHMKMYIKHHYTETTIITHYMEIYQVSKAYVAKILQIPVDVIDNYLEKGIITTETKSFIYWAIRNFRLDPNHYVSSLETSQNKKPIEIFL